MGRREQFARPEDTKSLWGRDFSGRAFFSTANPWVIKDRQTGEIVLNPVLASEYGIRISYDETTKEVVITRESF